MAKHKEGLFVDAEIQLAINDGNDRVIDILTERFDKRVDKLASDIEKYIDLLHKPLRNDVDRLRIDIAELYGRVSKLESRQSTDEGTQSVRDKMVENGFQAKQTSYAMMGVVAAVASVIVGLIVYFI